MNRVKLLSAAALAALTLVWAGCNDSNDPVSTRGNDKAGTVPPPGGGTTATEDVLGDELPGTTSIDKPCGDSLSVCTPPDVPPPPVVDNGGKRPDDTASVNNCNLPYGCGDGGTLPVGYKKYSLEGSDCKWRDDPLGWGFDTVPLPRTVIIINSDDELAGYVGCKGGTYPAVDFSKQTLLLATGLAGSPVQAEAGYLKAVSDTWYALEVTWSQQSIATVMTYWHAAVVVDNKITKNSKVELGVNTGIVTDPPVNPPKDKDTIAPPITPAVNAQYIRIGYSGGNKIPSPAVVSSKDELEHFYDAGGDDYPLSNPYTEFLKAINKYSNNYFADSSLVIVTISANSGSISYKVVGISDDGDIAINRLLPEIGTADMAMWSILIEVANKSKAEQYRVSVTDVKRDPGTVASGQLKK